MPSILIELDDRTLTELNRVAPAARRKRAEFVRQAIREAIRKHEYERIRDAYAAQPDSAAESDDWSSAEEWKP